MSQHIPIESGDILYGRPLFSNRPSDKKRKLSDKEHPVLVLSVATCEKTGNILALTAPISKSDQCAQNPYAVPIERDHNGPVNDSKQSWICCDSPNMIHLNGTDNGLRISTHAKRNYANTLKHGEIADKDLVKKSLAMTRQAIQEKGLQVPIQGDSLASLKAWRAAKEQSMETRIIDRVAHQNADDAVLHMQPLSDSLNKTRRRILSLNTQHKR